MDINEFIENFAEIFDEVNSEELSAETVFRNIDEWSSLNALSVLALSNELFDVELTAQELRNAQTIYGAQNETVDGVMSGWR